MRIAAAMARSGVSKVAITASPMVFTTAPPLGRDNLLQQPEMLVDEIEGDEVTDAFIELSGAPEITEQESQAQDLEALAAGERVGPVDGAMTRSSPTLSLAGRSSAFIRFKP